MTSATFSTSTEAQQAAALLDSYRFEMGSHDARQWVSLWLEFYRPSWIRDAVIEALYQGRYKSVSVRQILELWQRRGQPIRHVTHEFEAAVCREFGEVKVPPTPASLPVQHRSIRIKEQEENGLSQTSLSENSLASIGRASKAPVSFDLSKLAPLPPGMAAMVPQATQADNQGTTQAVTKSVTQPVTQANGKPQAKDEEIWTYVPNKDSGTSTRRDVLDNRAWRDFPSYTTPLYEQITETSDPQEVLQAQRQFNGILYSSARAIQPFKPALPFSAQTLRRAKQKAMDIMAEAR